MADLTKFLQIDLTKKKFCYLRMTLAVEKNKLNDLLYDKEATEEDLKNGLKKIDLLEKEIERRGN